jgi:hypothetical protein
MAAFPSSGTVDTQYLDAATDSPASARASIKDGLDLVQDIIDSYDSASGIAALDATGKIVNTKLPDSIVSSAGNNLTLSPDTEIVKINNVLTLTPRTTAQLNAMTVTEGTIAYASDGDGGDACLAVYDGSNWARISLGITIST